MSVNDLIRGDKDDLTEKDIIDAAESAQAHEFIISRPDGYGTVVG